MYLVGGSIPELEESTGNIYNTVTVYDPLGSMIASHRKVHLFDIDVPGKITFKVKNIVQSTPSKYVFNKYVFG